MERKEVEFDVFIKIIEWTASNESFICHVSKGIHHILSHSEYVERLNQELAGWSTVAWRAA